MDKDQWLAPKLLTWYDMHGRHLPWRTKPIKPYNVWISEIMLQQTTVQTVLPYFHLWMKRFPTLEDLTSASLNDVFSTWQGLGYYRRAQNLYACAQKLKKDYHGRFPQEVKILLTLPGLGPYTAAAIASIAFDKPVAAVDGNIARIFARLLQAQGTGPNLLRLVRKAAQSFVPPRRAGDYTQALMDLGATVCRPLKPNCTHCPIRSKCQSFQQETTHIFPQKAKKAVLPQKYADFFCLIREQSIYLVQETAPLLQHLWRPLRSPFQDKISLPPLFPINTSWQHTGTFAHTFTHFKLETKVWITQTKILDHLKDPNGAQGKWYVYKKLDTLPLSTLARKALSYVTPYLIDTPFNTKEAT